MIGGGYMNNCADKIVMSKIAFERMQAKDERDNHSKNIIIILLIILLVATNVVWLYSWNLRTTGDDYSIDIEQKDNGEINYTAGSFTITSETSQTEKEDHEP